MILTITGLPVNFSYYDVKFMIKQETGITNFILDDLVDENGGVTVTIGLADGSECPRLVNAIHGLKIGDNRLSVAPLIDSKRNDTHRPFIGDQRSQYESRTITPRYLGDTEQASSSGSYQDSSYPVSGSHAPSRQSRWQQEPNDKSYGDEPFRGRTGGRERSPHRYMPQDNHGDRRWSPSPRAKSRSPVRARSRSPVRRAWRGTNYSPPHQADFRRSSPHSTQPWKSGRRSPSPPQAAQSSLRLSRWNQPEQAGSFNKSSHDHGPLDDDFERRAGNSDLHRDNSPLKYPGEHSWINNLPPKDYIPSRFTPLSPRRNERNTANSASPFCEEMARPGSSDPYFAERGSKHVTYSSNQKDVPRDGSNSFFRHEYSENFERQNIRNVPSEGKVSKFGSQSQDRIYSPKTSETQRMRNFGSPEPQSMQNFGLSERPRMQNFESTEPPRMHNFESSEPLRKQSFGLSEPPRMQNFGLPEPPRMQNFGLSEPQRMQNFGPTESQRMPYFGPTQPQLIQMFGPNDPQRTQYIHPDPQVVMVGPNESQEIIRNFGSTGSRNYDTNFPSRVGPSEFRPPPQEIPPWSANRNQSETRLDSRPYNDNLNIEKPTFEIPLRGNRPQPVPINNAPSMGSRNLRSPPTGKAYEAQLPQNLIGKEQRKPGIEQRKPPIEQNKPMTEEDKHLAEMALRDKVVLEIVTTMLKRFRPKIEVSKLYSNMEHELKIIVLERIDSIFGISNGHNFTQIVSGYRKVHKVNEDWVLMKQMVMKCTSHNYSKTKTIGGAAPVTNKPVPVPVVNPPQLPSAAPVPANKSAPVPVVKPPQVPSGDDLSKYHSLYETLVARNFGPNIPPPPLQIVPQFDDATKKLFVIKDDFTPISPAEAIQIRDYLVEEIVKAAADSNFKPSFMFNGLRNMASFEVVAEDEKSKKWLLAHDISSFKSLNLLVYTMEHLTYERASIWLPGHLQLPLNPLEKLRLQNRNMTQVDLNKWILVKAIRSEKGTRIFVDMDKPSSNGLAQYNMTLNYEFEKVFVVLKCMAADRGEFDKVFNEPSITLDKLNFVVPDAPTLPHLTKKTVRLSLQDKYVTKEMAHNMKFQILSKMYEDLLHSDIKINFSNYGLTGDSKFLAFEPENTVTSDWLMSLDVIVDDTKVVIEKGLYFPKNLKVAAFLPGELGLFGPSILQKFDSSNKITGVDFTKWSLSAQIVNKTETGSKVAINIDLESMLALRKIHYCLKYNKNTVTLKHNHHSLLRSYMEMTEEIVDSYDVADMDIDEDEENEELATLSSECMKEINSKKNVTIESIDLCDVTSKTERIKNNNRITTDTNESVKMRKSSKQNSNEQMNNANTRSIDKLTKTSVENSDCMQEIRAKCGDNELKNNHISVSSFCQTNDSALISEAAPRNTDNSANLDKSVISNSEESGQRENAETENIQESAQRDEEMTENSEESVQTNEAATENMDQSTQIRENIAGTTEDGAQRNELVTENSQSIQTNDDAIDHMNQIVQVNEAATGKTSESVQRNESITKNTQESVQTSDPATENIRIIEDATGNTDQITEINESATENIDQLSEICELDGEMQPRDSSIENISCDNNTVLDNDKETEIKKSLTHNDIVIQNDTEEMVIDDDVILLERQEETIITIDSDDDDVDNSMTQDLKSIFKCITLEIAKRKTEDPLGRDMSLRSKYSTKTDEKKLKYFGKFSKMSDDMLEHYHNKLTKLRIPQTIRDGSNKHVEEMTSLLSSIEKRME